MPRHKIDDDELLAGLMNVFQEYGYEAASLSLISEATGLRRASLYHRFPGGKEDMVEAVMTEADRIFEEEVLAPLAMPGKPASRARRMAGCLAEFYEDGTRSCLLDTLSLGDASARMVRHVKRSLGVWVDAMVGVAREAGATPAAARRRAEDALIQIQGALVLSRASGDSKPFKRVLAGLPALLTGAPA